MDKWIQVGTAVVAHGRGYLGADAPGTVERLYKGEAKVRLENGGWVWEELHKLTQITSPEV